MKKTAIGIALVLLGCSRTGSAEPPPTGSAQITAAQASLVAPALAAPRAVLGDDALKLADVSTRFQRSYDLEAAGALDDALAALDPPPNSGTGTYVATLRRAWLLYRLGKSADAVVAYEKAGALEPTSLEAKVGELAPLAAMRRWVDVERVARDVLQRDPASYQANLRLAFALYSQARFEPAAATYRALLTVYPSDVDVRGGLGWSLLELGKSGEAAAAFAQVLEVAPKNALALDGARASKRNP